MRAPRAPPYAAVQKEADTLEDASEMTMLADTTEEGSIQCVAIFCCCVSRAPPAHAALLCCPFAYEMCSQDLVGRGVCSL